MDRIENLETDNPKEYWSLVNQLRNEHSDKPESSIDGETWYKYFSELTSLKSTMHSKSNKIEEKLKLLEQKSEGFSTLDYEITTGELQKAFSKLKSWKSPGLDNVSNEMLRERPFNLKGGYGFFLKKNILIPNVAEKNILILVEEKKKI